MSIMSSIFVNWSVKDAESKLLMQDGLDYETVSRGEAALAEKSNLEVQMISTPTDLDGVAQKLQVALSYASDDDTRTWDLIRSAFRDLAKLTKNGGGALFEVTLGAAPASAPSGQLAN
jgi:hypothetical protein